MVKLDIYRESVHNNAMVGQWNHGVSYLPIQRITSGQQLTMGLVETDEMSKLSKAEEKIS